MASGHRHRYFETGLTSPPLRPFLIHSPCQSGSSVRVDRPLEASPKSKCQSIRLFSRQSLSLSPSFFFCLSKRPLSFPPSLPPSLFFRSCPRSPPLPSLLPATSPAAEEGRRSIRPTDLPNYRSPATAKTDFTSSAFLGVSLICVVFHHPLLLLLVRSDGRGRADVRRFLYR